MEGKSRLEIVCEVSLHFCNKKFSLSSEKKILSTYIKMLMVVIAELWNYR